MVQGVVIRKVPLSPGGTAFIGKRPLTISERESIAKRFSLGGAASFGGTTFRADVDRATREAAVRRKAEVSSFRGQVVFIGSERSKLEAESSILKSQKKELDKLKSDIDRRQASLIQRSTLATTRLVSEFNKKSTAFNTRATNLEGAVNRFNLKASQSGIRAGQLNISLSAKEERALSMVEAPPVKEFVVTPDVAPRLAPFGLETQQARLEIQRRQEELRIFGERPPAILEFAPAPITDFPTFVGERSAEIRARGKEIFETIAAEQLSLLMPPKKDVIKRKVKGIEKRVKLGLGVLDVGTGAAGLGFVALGEPFIGALPDTAVKFELPFIGERQLTPGGFRGSLDISGQFAFLPAVFKAPGAVKALPKAISATRLEFAGLQPLKLPKSFGQTGEFGIFEKKGAKVKFKMISKAQARELRKQGIILGKPGELELAPLPTIKITPAEAKSLREFGVLVKPTAPAKFVAGEPTAGVLPRGVKVKVPKLGQFLDPARPLTFKEKKFLESLAKPLGGKTKTFVFGKAPKGFGQPTITLQPIKSKTTLNELFRVKPPVVKEFPTTAALRQAPQLSFKEFSKQLKAVESFGKPVPAQRFLGIPGSAKALAFGLPLRPKGKQFEDTIFIRTELRGGKLPSLFPDFTKEIKITTGKFKPIDVFKKFQIKKLKTKPISIQRQKLKQVTILKTSSILKLKDISIVQPIVSQKQIELIIPKPITIQAQAERFKFAELQKQSIKQITLTVPKQRQKQRQIFKQPRPPKEPFKRTSRFPPFALPILDVGKPRRPRKRVKVQAFASFVKKKGKLVKVSKRPLRKNTALALSLFVADNTAARTATIRKISGTPVGAKRSKPSLRKFRNPIRGGKMKAIPNLFIEKSRFAIDRPGEAEAITKRGLEALRKGFFRKKKAIKRKRTKRRGFLDVF